MASILSAQKSNGFVSIFPSGTREELPHMKISYTDIPFPARLGVISRQARRMLLAYNLFAWG
jgi:hypothetical protein